MDITLTDAVDKLIGNYQAYGETNHDDDALKNLDSVWDLTTYLISNLCDNAEKMNHCAYSIAEVGTKSKQILDEVQSMLDDLNYDLSVENKNTTN